VEHLHLLASALAGCQTVQTTQSGVGVWMRDVPGIRRRHQQERGLPAGAAGRAERASSTATPRSYGVRGIMSRLF
jgi:hypothetical protein